MKILLVLGTMLFATAAFAQGTPAPAGDTPTAQVKPTGTAATSDAKSKPNSKSTSRSGPKSVAEKVQACLEIDDGTKGRLDCYDAAVPPKPSAKPVKAKGVLDCRFLKEEDERLACFNGFADQIPKFTH
jgi:hypothetical protein